MKSQVSYVQASLPYSTLGYYEMIQKMIKLKSCDLQITVKIK